MAGGKFSEALLNGMTIRESATDGSDFTNPTADYRRLYLGEDGLLHVKDSAGTVTSPYSLSAATAIGARATNTAGTAITTGTPTAMPLATEDYDTSSFHDLVTNNTRITVPTGLGGKYMVTGQYTLSTANITNVYCVLRKNGTTDLAFMGRFGGETAGASGLNLSAIVALVATDYVELIVHHAHGSNRNLETTAGYNWLAIAFFGT